MKRRVARKIKVLGIGGTVQSGKSELKEVFVEHGMIFHDLNDPWCDLRAKGTARYEIFNERFPGCLRDDGAKLPPFYDLVTPEFLRDWLREDLVAMVPIVQSLCKEAGDKPVALSWEYLPALAKHLPIDHALLMTSNEVVWKQRLHARLRGRGMVGEITDDRINRLLDLLDVRPEKILEEFQHQLAGKFTTFDVSGADWGAYHLHMWLRSAVGQ